MTRTSPDPDHLIPDAAEPRPTFQPFMHDLTVAHPDEERLGREIDETMAQIRETTFENSGHATRSVHAKGHGILQAELEIFEGLPPLAQGIFSRPGNHQVIMRFSTTPGDLLSDNVSTPRAVAFKVLDVEGERLPDSEASRSQDFIMVNDPTFNAPDAATFVKAFKPLAATTDRMEGFKKIFSTALRGVEMAVEAVGGESAKLKAFGGEPRRHILGETFFNQLPLRYGDNIAKLSLAPISEELKALTDKQLEDGDDPDALRSAVRSFFEQHSGEWEVRVQLCTNLTDMPIEKADAEWDEKQSPYLPVAILRAARQDSWPDQRATDIEDGLGFSPWNGVVEHWPLGSLNRIRKVVYEHSQQFRSERNRCPVHERKS